MHATVTADGTSRPAARRPGRCRTSPAELPPLDDRKLRILRAIVTEYVADGEPVGSRRVVEVARLDVSAATVRNEMAALEELGYITQPHTSAGRVPTDRGYRRFVDDLADRPGPRRPAARADRGAARVGPRRRGPARPDLVGAQPADPPGLARHRARPSTRRAASSSSWSGLSSSSALLLLVADTGRVEKRTVDLPAGTTETDLDRVRTVLGDQVRGRPMGEVHATLRALTDGAPERPARAAARRHRRHRRRTSSTTPSTTSSSAVGRRSPTRSALERDELSRVLQLLEERATLARLLAETTDDAPLVRIGGENTVEDLRATSLVAQRYRVVTAGSLGVLGPTRMDYASVLSTVRAVADELQRSLADLSG